MNENITFQTITQPSRYEESKENTKSAETSYKKIPEIKKKIHLSEGKSDKTERKKKH